MMNGSEPILLFDGVCNLCSSSVQFVLKHNAKGNVRFASLQSDVGKQLLSRFGILEGYIESLVLIENDRVYMKSDAALRLSEHFSGIWKLGKLFLIFPRSLRDALYNFIAKNRYRWFGKTESCWLPQSQWKHRFLDSKEHRHTN